MAEVQTWTPDEPTAHVDETECMAHAQAMCAEIAPRLTVSIEHVEPGGYCSQHRHIYRWIDPAGTSRELVLRAEPDEQERAYLARELSK